MANQIEGGKCDLTKKLQLEQFFRMIDLRPQLERLPADDLASSPVSFICGTREPISWALSAFFQAYELGDVKAAALQLEQLRGNVLWLFQKPPPDWLYGFVLEEWFENEVTGFLGVNLAQAGFDTARGFQVYETKRGRLLIIRQENLAKTPEALSELMIAPRSLFEVSRENVTEDKETGSYYREVASKLRFPVSFLEELYSRPYSVTFYSPEERAAFIEKWRER